MMLKNAIKANFLAPLKLTEYMGAIISWGIFRFAILLVSMWLLRDGIVEYGDWWMLFFFAVGAVVLFPAQIQYYRHRDRVTEINKDILCTSCKHYNAAEALCTSLDEDVTEIHIPCEGFMWEPKSS